MKVLLDNYNLSLSPISKTLFESMYNSMKKSYNYILKQKPTIRYYKSFHKNIVTELVRNPDYIGVENLENYIKKQTIGYYEVSLDVGDRQLQIYFVLFDQKDKTLPIEFYVSLISSYIHYIGKMAKGNCSKKLRIFLYLTPFKKKLYKGDKVLTKKNVNSAVTYSCKEHNEICVYRKEEFMKVLFHEVLHSLGMDNNEFYSFGFVSKMRDFFHVKTTELYNEAYVEVFALNFYIMFLSILSKNKEQAFKKYQELIRIETYFSIFQMVKILEHFSLSYSDILENYNTHLYKEETNAFAYYILKAILLYNNKDSFQHIWRKKMNLFQHIRTFSLNPAFQIELKQFELKKIHSKELNETMRMSAYLGIH